MSEWFDILKQSRQTSLSEFDPESPSNASRQKQEQWQQFRQSQQQPKIRRVKTQPTQRGRTSGANKLPPSMRLKPQLQQQELEQRRQAQTRGSPKPKIDSQTGGQFSPLSAKPVYGIQEQALANPDPTYKNLSVQEVKDLKRAGMPAAQISNINNQSSTLNQMQSPTQRRLAQAKGVAGRAGGALGRGVANVAGGIKQRLGQMVTPSPNQPRGAQASVPSPTEANVAAQPNPQVIQQLEQTLVALNSQLEQVYEPQLKQGVQNKIKEIQAQLEAEKKKGTLHNRAVKRPVAGTPVAGSSTTPPPPRTPRPFSASTIQTMAKSEWFNVLYSHQTM